MFKVLARPGWYLSSAHNNPPPPPGGRKGRGGGGKKSFSSYPLLTSYSVSSDQGGDKLKYNFNDR